MANKEHIQILGNSLVSLSMREWNQWRMENWDSLPDLSGEDLSHSDLTFINLSSADLRKTDFSSANLHHANLRKADLRESQLRNANLSNADLSFARLKDADLRAANLHHAILRGADLQGAKLEHVDFRRADLTDALIDPSAINQSTNWFNSGISRIEKIALGLLGRKPVEKFPGEAASPGTKAEPPSQMKHL